MMRRWLTVLACCSTSACYRYNTVTDLRASADIRGKVELTAEARATHARRLGGVATEVLGMIAPLGADSISVKADVVRFSDIGPAQYGGGELRFARSEISRIAAQVPDKKRSVMVAAAAAVGVALIGAGFATGDGFLGVGRTNTPTAR